MERDDPIQGERDLELQVRWIVGDFITLKNPQTREELIALARKTHELADQVITDTFEDEAYDRGLTDDDADEG